MQMASGENCLKDKNGLKFFFSLLQITFKMQIQPFSYGFLNNDGLILWYLF